ncbi:aminoglycoside phosphotransferase family protein [Microbacterium sp. STF-2]|uniref:aminoglycoside phosphotransferase family protein n=1 Tax=Microbacterium sp. STF-2 TaxID=3031132 RepID=UPI002AFE4C9C|nr:aminoglycoside phosphotransferase family protein [Microbacterium sp. STF-2]MEA1262070.1 aminoglycoside phosphotransferase family protein [Microbacterium sp. STF-2]
MADSPAAELTLAEREVRELLHGVAPQWAALPLTRVAEGWDNVTWRLGPDLAVRIPRRERAAPLIRHEQRALPAIALRLAPTNVRTPLPVFAGAPTPMFPWPWSIVPWLPGSHALGRARRDNTSWAADLAAVLVALHHDAPVDAPRNPVRGVPLSARDESIRSRLADLAPALAEPLDALWQTGLDAAPAAESTWIHGDLHPGNILVDGDRLSALIDFGDVTSGDPAYDLAAGWLAFDTEGRHVFRRATASRYDDATWMRARAWAAAVATILCHSSDDREDLRALGHDTALELSGVSSSC